MSIAFTAGILAASTPRTTKAEIVEYYQEKYPGKGKGGWKQHLVNDLAPIAGKKPKNLERRFDPSRLNNPEKRNAKEYEQLGEQLPPIAPENGFHIEGTVWIQYSQDCEEREIDEDITGDDAQELVRMAQADMARQAISNVYNGMDANDEEGYHPCNEDAWNLTVSVRE